MIRKANGQNLRITANAQVGSESACVSETILGSVTLPPNFLSAGAIITVRNSCRKSSTSSAFTYKLYFNTTANITGALQLGTFTVSNTSVSPNIYRRFVFTSATTAAGLASTFSASNDVGDFTSTVATFTFTNWLVGGGVFFVTGLRSAGTDTLQLINISLEV